MQEQSCRRHHRSKFTRQHRTCPLCFLIARRPRVSGKGRHHKASALSRSLRAALCTPSLRLPGGGPQQEVDEEEQTVWLEERGKQHLFAAPSGIIDGIAAEANVSM